MAKIKGYRITADGKVIKSPVRKSVSERIRERTSKRQSVVSKGKALTNAEIRSAQAPKRN